MPLQSVTPPRPVKGSLLLSIMLQQTERTFPGDFVLNQQNASAEYFEDGM